MQRGDKPITFVRESQIKSFINKNGWQISKGGLNILARHLELIMRHLMQIAEKTVDAKRLNDMHIMQMLESLYEGIPNESIKPKGLRKDL